MQTPSTTLPAVLIVEDDCALVALLRYNLEESGFAVVVASDGLDALDRFAAAVPQIILLDWMLPSLSGIELCREIRLAPAGRTIPIIMISARSSEQDTVLALDAGVDDYVVKPFTFGNLLARMRGLLRRGDTAPPHEQVAFGGIVMDLTARRVHRDGRLLPLGGTEFRLLHFLMRHPRRVFTRAEVLDAVWGRTVDVEPRTLDVHVGRLRKAIAQPGGADMIRTVRGAGYALDDSAE